MFFKKHNYKYPLYDTYQVNTIREVIENATKSGGDKIAFQEKEDFHNPFITYTFNEIREKIRGFTGALLKLGVTEEDKIAVISENRTAWAITYLSVTSGGAIIVPVDKESKEQELFHILHASEAKAIIYSAKYSDVIEDLSKNLPNLSIRINMDLKKSRETAIDSTEFAFNEIIKEGIEYSKSKNQLYFRENVEKDDIASLLFTSGTTAIPKIVPLSHFNICSNIMAMIALVGIQHNDHFLSVLPMHHVYECTCGFLCPYSSGCTITFVPNLRRVAETLAESKATIMLGVPMLFKAIYKRLVGKLTEKFPTKMYYHTASILSAITKTKLGKTVFSPLHKKLGGNLRLFITGGAAMDPHISEGFQKLGFNLIQGYGLTETSPILAVNRPVGFKNASVGEIMPSCEVKIYNPDENNEGEILARGDSVFRGYYKNPDVNQDSFTDGWFKTGDMGYFDNDGLLYVVGRCKNVIVTDGGKNVYPEELEENLNRSYFILESVVTTVRDKTTNLEKIHAIIVPDYETFDTYCKTQKILNTEQALHDIIKQEVKNVSDALADFKRIQGFTIRAEEFTKTSTKKIKRHSI